MSCMMFPHYDRYASVVLRLVRKLHDVYTCIYRLLIVCMPVYQHNLCMVHCTAIIMQCMVHYCLTWC